MWLFRCPMYPLSTAVSGWYQLFRARGRHGPSSARLSDQRHVRRSAQYGWDHPIVRADQERGHLRSAVAILSGLHAAWSPIPIAALS